MYSQSTQSFVVVPRPNGVMLKMAVILQHCCHTKAKTRSIANLDPMKLWKQAHELPTVSDTPKRIVFPAKPLPITVSKHGEREGKFGSHPHRKHWPEIHSQSAQL